MTFFNASEPWLRPKQTALDVQDLEGLWIIRLKLGRLTLICSHYTRIDQIFMFWSVVAALIFFAAQFTSLSWTLQAWLWSVLSLGTGLVMAVWSWRWTEIEQLRWLIWLWLGVVAAGVGLTDYSIFAHWGMIMGHLCQLWLGLCMVGYLLTGIGLQSRSLCVVSLLHGLGLLLLPWVSSYQFLTTGLIIGSTLLVLGECQWDMRPPTTFANLTASQLEFNMQQHGLRTCNSNTYD
jgi:hypothetical protein